jgi:prepilin-type N-terminal cleavage/methylation domain-containing protein
MRYLMRRGRAKAFTLVEVLAALAILAIISSSVLVVIGRCTASATDSVLQMQAFEVARWNMERLLASDSVKESIEYGQSEEYPEIAWERVVETFYEPITTRMWIRGICTAEYKDTEGQDQKVELVHWLTDLTKEQLLQIMKQREGEEQLADQLLETMEDAAEYAGVDVETIEQWVQDGMLTTDDGSFIKDNLDLYRRSNGKPSTEDKDNQVATVGGSAAQSGTPGGQDAAGTEGWQDEVDPKTGLTYGELENMDFSEIWDILKSRQR